MAAVAAAAAEEQDEELAAEEHAGRDEETTGQRAFLEEAEELARIVAQIAAANGAGLDSSLFTRAGRIFAKYQEQPQLLDPHLERLVVPLMAVLRRQADGPLGAEELAAVCSVGRVVQWVINVRGQKIVSRFFPHAPSDFEPAIRLLEHCRQVEAVRYAITNPAREVEERGEGSGAWETLCTLLAWLAVLALAPFDLVSLDTGLGKVPLIDLLVSTCQEDFLGDPGAVRDMAAWLLGRLLTRPDTRSYLQAFVGGFCHNALCEGRSTDVLLSGVLAAVAIVLNLGGRSALLQVVPQLWTDLCTSGCSTSSSIVVRKLAVKVTARIGLVHLAPRVVAWRYQRGNRSLVSNLADPSTEAMVPGSTPSTRQQPHLIPDVPADDEEYDVPDVIEDVIERLLVGLRDKDTVARWSAAKGIGRITSRLPIPFADQVVESVVDLFNPAEGDGAWHGGCLAIAELARRGLLLPARLPQVVPLVIQSLSYEIRRGPHSIGAHVRDAAAYVCWAFARAYSPEVMKPHVHTLAPALLTLAMYDREVNCRRAAAAAFQESVGRQSGTFPHGIDIVGEADYYTLGNRQAAYLKVAPFVASFEEYRSSLVTHLLEHKLRHWERSLRELAAEALAALAPHCSEALAHAVETILVLRALSVDLVERHGALVALAALVPALPDLRPEVRSAVLEVVPAIEKARLYRGRGGDMVRAAACSLIKSIAVVHIPLSGTMRSQLLNSLDDHLVQPSEQVQAAAAEALRIFVPVYFRSPEPESVARTTVKYATLLVQSSNPAERRGCALALGALPRHLLLPAFSNALTCLCQATAIEEDVERRDAETRVNAVKSLVSVALQFSTDSQPQESEAVVRPDAADAASATASHPPSGLLNTTQLRDQVLSVMLAAVDDYATDNRGDVGSLVREAAMEAIAVLGPILCSLGGLSNQDWATRLVAGLAKQAAEKIDRVRLTAGSAITRIVTAGVPCAHRKELEEIFLSSYSINWAVPAQSFPRIVQLLHLPPYRLSVVAGLIISVGAVADSLVKCSSAALLSQLEDNDGLARDLLVDIVGVLKSNPRNERVAVPLLRTLETVFSSGSLEAIMESEGQVALELVNLVRAELRGAKDIAKLMAGVSVLCHFVGHDHEGGASACKSLLLLLVHKYPRIRCYVAEQLYATLLMLGVDSSDAAETRLEDAMEILLNTQWDLPVSELRPLQDQLYPLLRITP
eukprot:jgi/Chlat1/7803/Chrsp66S07259